MSRRLDPLVLGALLGLAACSGDDIIEPTPGEFELLCGEAAPLHLLPMAPGDVPGSVRTRAFGQRYVVDLRYGEISEAKTSTIWSVGQCGEDPQLLIEGVVSTAGPYEPWPDVPFVCAEASGRLLALDTSGALPPNQVFETRDCFYLRTPEGIVTILGEGDTGPLVLQPWPDDPLAESAEQIVLVDAVRASVVFSSHTGPSQREVLATTETEVFAVTPSDDLVVVSLADLGVEVLGENVREFTIGPNGRFVLWQGIEVTNNDFEWPEGQLWLLDRQTGVTTLLDETAIAYSHNPLYLEPLGLLHYRGSGQDFDPGADRWVRLDDLEPYTLVGSMYAWFRIDDQRALFSSHGADAPLMLLDAPTGELSLLDDGPQFWTIPHDDGLWIQRDQGGELLDVGYGGDVRTLARHVLRGWQMLAGERVVTLHDVGDDDIGSLLIVDPDTLDEAYVAHGVREHSIGSPDATDTEPGELVSYMVIANDPERHGIWLAKPE